MWFEKSYMVVRLAKRYKTGGTFYSWGERVQFCSLFLTIFSIELALLFNSNFDKFLLFKTAKLVLLLLYIRPKLVLI